MEPWPNVIIYGGLGSTGHWLEAFAGQAMWPFIIVLNRLIYYSTIRHIN